MSRLPFLIALVAGLTIVWSAISLFQHASLFESTFWLSGSVRPLHTESQQKAFDSASPQQHLLGVGKADITGPVVEINFMGYADPSQVGTGLRQRLYSRAFIVGSTEHAEDRFVYLVLDTQSGDTAVRHGILDALTKLGAEYAVYGQQNIAVTGTHSHSGPGAWLNYLLPQITSKGFDKSSYEAIVDGAVESIKRAHRSLAPGHLTYGEIEIIDANVNRSPYAYLANPKEERARYENDVDKMLTMLRFTHSEGSKNKDIGVLTWFAVHGTSMLGNNTLVTGDNKGVASWLFEKASKDPKFVAGFSQANVGDTSPNVLGAFCESGETEGQLCDFKTSLCGNRTQPCRGRGPYFGRDDAGTASTYEIGRRQFEGAWKHFQNQSAFAPVTGQAIGSVHRFVDLSTYKFPLANGSFARTCPAALGYSFAAGTTDGPGAFDFKQAQPGDPHANPLWAVIGNRIHTPNNTQKACHGEKVILLDVGESNNPYPWSPNIVDIQLFRAGQFFIIVSPGEATTMAGRRWRDALRDSVMKTFPEFSQRPQPTVVLGGPANSYTHYIATEEEYAVQRYEGASTLYGPHTLEAYTYLTLSYLPQLSSAQTQSKDLGPEPQPPILINSSLSFITPVIVDRPGLLKSFGDPLHNPKATNLPGDTISATFAGANPRNNFRLGGTFAAVERFDFRSKVWRQFRTDEDWSLVFEWKRTSTIIGTSEVTISWETQWETGVWKGALDLSEPHGDLLARYDELVGLYRIRYYGDAKSLGGKITEFTGVSDEFRII